ncbi:MAG: hypothetical protein ACJAYH_000522 [Celeribacter sp.]|jgi:hypothetical protein
MEMLSMIKAKTSRKRTPKFAAGLVAFSMAVTATFATPARADDADVARAIGGLLTLFVIGKAIENSNSKSNPTTVTRKVTVDDSGMYRDRERDRDKGRDRRTKRGNAFEIPNTCVVSVKGKRERIQTVAIEACVMRERRSAMTLPRACETKVRTKRGRMDAYDVGCLNNFGYRVTRAGSRDGSRALR